MTDQKPAGVFVRLPLSVRDAAYMLMITGTAEVQPSLLAIGTPVTGGELGVVDYSEYAPEYHDQGMGCGLEDRGIHDRYEAMGYGWDQAIERACSELPETVLLSDALAKLAEKDAEIARLQAKQPLYDRMVQENGELKLAVARLQRPEFYGTESQDTGSEDISSLFDFCKDNEVIEINGYRCVSTQFGFFDGTDVHLYGSEDEALSAVKVLKGPEA